MVVCRREYISHGKCMMNWNEAPIKEVMYGSRYVMGAGRLSVAAAAGTVGDSTGVGDTTNGAWVGPGGWPATTGELTIGAVPLTIAFEGTPEAPVERKNGR